MLIYYPFHVLGNWIIYQVFFLCIPPYFWVLKILFIFLQENSLGYNYISRISGSKLRRILKALIHCNRFCLRKTEPICPMPQSGFYFPTILTTMTSDIFKLSSPCFAAVFMLVVPFHGEGEDSADPFSFTTSFRFQNSRNVILSESLFMDSAVKVRRKPDLKWLSYQVPLLRWRTVLFIWI